MPTISTCPNCSEMVSIPRGLDATTLVRCPLCGAEYPLGAAIDMLPPKLIPVETSDEANLSGPGQPANQADQPDADIIPLDSAAPRSIPIQTAVKPPHIKPASATENPKPVAGLISEPVFAPDAESAGESAVPPQPADEEPSVSPPPIVSSFLFQYGGAECGQSGSPPIFAHDDDEESAETAESPLDADVYDLIAKHKQKTKKESQDQTESSTNGRQAQGKPKSVLRIFFAYIFGGLAGITIGYVILAWLAVWIMGPRFDLPAPPKILKPVLRFVLPDRIWQENQQPRKNP
jgi:hypothetical protein